MEEVGGVIQWINNLVVGWVVIFDDVEFFINKVVVWMCFYQFFVNGFFGELVGVVYEIVWIFVIDLKVFDFCEIL